MKKIIIATKNESKLIEMKNAFKELPVEVIALKEYGEIPDAIEDGKTFLDNALIKAKYFQQQTHCACIADDSGLEVDALNGMPGIYSARFAGYHAEDETNNQKLIDELERVGVNESNADYKCALVFVDVDGTQFETEGVCYGKVKKIAKGREGFGYDPYFYIEEDKTMAELPLSRKNEISHRGEAVRKMVNLLREYFTS